MASRLANNRTLVIGASSGIGKAIAEKFAEQGAEVVIASRSIDKLSEMVENTDGIRSAVVCNVRDTSSVDNAIAETRDSLGGLDTVINSAGVITRADIVGTDDDALEWVVDVNLQGMMRVARAAIPPLKQTDGSLVLVSSQLGEVGVEGASVYCATKGGINNLTRQLAVEYAQSGVRVNALAPGIVKTPMNEHVRDAEWSEKKQEQIPLDRFATPDEVADPAVFLASDEASYITGHVLVIDGGYIAR